MANPYKGEVDFEAGGKTYKLSFSADAMCELEEVMKKDTDEIFAMLSDPKKKVRLGDLRIMFWKGLGDHHPGMSFEDARAVLKQVRPVDMGTLLATAFVRSMPEVVDKSGANPPLPVDPEDGIGPASLMNGAH